MKRIIPRATTMRKVGEFRHRMLALFLSVLLAITCLPIMPGSTKEAQAETPNVTVTGYAKVDITASANVAIEVYAEVRKTTANLGGTPVFTINNAAVLNSKVSHSLNTVVKPGIYSDAACTNQISSHTGTPTVSITDVSTGMSDDYKNGSVSANMNNQPQSGTYSSRTFTANIGAFSHTVQNAVQVGSTTYNIGSAKTASVSGYSHNVTWDGSTPVSAGYLHQQHNVSLDSVNSGGTIEVKVPVTYTDNNAYNPTNVVSPDLYKNINSSVVDWAEDISATWGYTTTNTIPSMGAITDSSLTGGTDADIANAAGTVFDKVGIKTHNYLIQDDHALDPITPDGSFANAVRNIIVQATTEPQFDIKYAATALDKDGTPISGAPYGGEWTNQPLEMDASHTDPGTYDTAIRKYEPFASGTYVTEASDLTNSHLINIPSYQTDSTTAAGTGFTAILEEEDPMTPGTFIDLSPESTKKMVKIDTGMPAPAATYVGATFNDTSTDPDGLSLIDASRQKIAIVPTGDPAPTNYYTDFVSFAALNSSNINPGYYDVYVWAWDNAGNNTSAQVLNNQLIISADAPTIAGALASGPNSGQALASNMWTNQDVEVTVTHPASITSGYATLLDGLITEVKATTVNTPASKTYTAETLGTTLDGVILDSGTTELSQHSSNYVVKIDKTDPVAAVTYNGSPNYDFADNSTDTASPFANSGVNPAKTIICFETPGTVTPPAKSKYEPLIGATLPATGWYDVWVIATDYAGNESAPVKAYDHISRSGKDEITAKDFAWDIAKGSGSFDASMSQMLSHVKGIPYGSNTPFPLSQIDVDAAELAAIVAAIDAGQKGTVWDLTFSTPGGATQATTTITVTLFDSGSNVPVPPGPLTQELIFANDFNWGISTGQLTDDPARNLSQVVGYKAGGDKFATGDLGVDSGELAAINAAISAGQKNSTFPLTFTTNGSTGPAASVTINVTLFDNGPQGPIPAGSEQIVGNNFKWGIDSGDVSSAIAQHLGKIQATGATGAPMAASSISIDGAELAALNAAIAAGQVGTTWPLTFTTDGSTGTPASVTIYVTLFDAGHQTPVVGDPYIVANHFSRAISAGALDDATAKTDSLTEALNSIGHTGDNAHISVDAAELAVINASIAAGDVSKPPYPLTFTYSCPVSSKTVSAVALVTLTGDKELVVTKTVDNENPLPGDTITYTIKAKNNGNVAINGLWVKDNVPANTTFVSCDANGVYGSAVNGQEYVNWYFATISAGQEVVMTLTVKINECSPGTEIVNVALYEEGATGMHSDPNENPNGGKSNGAKSTVGDLEKQAGKESVKVRKLRKAGDGILPALVGGIAIVACGAVIFARRKDKKNDVK